MIFNFRNKKSIIFVVFVSLLTSSIIAFLATWITVSGKGKGQNVSPIKTGQTYHVVYVFDGDTISVYNHGKEMTVRLLGINTPEIAHYGKKAECYGIEAKNEALRLLSGTDVYIEGEPWKYDKFGRLLAFIRTKSGLSYNEYMVKSGFAREYTFKGQHYKYQDEFKKDEKEAIQQNLGLWNKKNCP